MTNQPNDPAGISTMTPAAILKSVRVARKMALRRMADLLGIGHSSLHNLEGGLRPIPIEVALRIEEITGGAISAGQLNESVSVARLSAKTATAPAAPNRQTQLRLSSRVSARRFSGGW